MKRIIFTFLTLCIAVAMVSAQIQKTLVKSYNLNGVKVVVLDLKAEVVFKTSDNAALRLETDINLKNGNVSLFQVLQAKKRYDLQVNNDGATFRLSAPDLEIVKFGGQELQETIVYNVFVPENVKASVVKDDLHTYIIVEKNDKVVVSR